jgi:hypothetical protein
LIQIHRDRRSSKHAALAEVTNDMTLYKAVRLPAIAEAIHNPVPPDGTSRSNGLAGPRCSPAAVSKPYGYA